MALDRWLALLIALIFLIYGYTAFFQMDGLLPPILQRNPVWPSTFPKILSVIGVIGAVAVLVNIEKSDKQIGDDIDMSNWQRYKVFDALALIAGMIVYALTLRALGFLAATFLFFTGRVLAAPLSLAHPCVWFGVMASGIWLIPCWASI